MNTLLTSYNNIPRNSVKLNEDKAEGIIFINSLCRYGSAADEMRGQAILVALAKFKYYRNEHIPLIRDTYRQQGQALQELSDQCEMDEDYQSVLSLARNKGTGGLLRDLPHQLRDLFNANDPESLKGIASALTVDQRNFLYHAGVNIPLDLAKEHTTDLSDPVHVPQATGFKPVSAKGNPKHGTIYHFGQLHDRPEIAGDSQTLERVAQSQRLILNSLLHLKFEHVFVESRPETIYKVPEHIKELVQPRFKNYKPGDELTDIQKQTLVRWGAEVVYASLNGSVVLHGTSNPEASAKCEKFDAENSGQGFEKILRLMHGDLSLESYEATKKGYKVIHAEREELAMQRMQEFFRRYGYQSVALVYGAGHDFSWLLDRDEFSPVFYRRDFDPADALGE